MHKRFEPRQVHIADTITLPWRIPGDPIYWVFWLGLFSIVLTAARSVFGYLGIACVVVIAILAFYSLIIRKGYMRRWVIDFSKRLIYREGSTKDHHVLNDDYAICLYCVMVSSGVLLDRPVEAWIVELTHRRKGPISRLYDFVGADQTQAIDFAGTLAHRLHLRTVGSGFASKGNNPQD